MGWQKTRVFICSWRKPKYPRQQLCCRYYCLISPSPGGISGSLPDDGWNHPSLSNESTGLSGSCCLCTLSANHPTQQSHEEAAAEARHHTLSLLTAAWLSDTSSVGLRHFLIVNMQPAMCGKCSKLSYTSSLKRKGKKVCILLSHATRCCLCAETAGNADVYTKRLAPGKEQLTNKR